MRDLVPPARIAISGAGGMLGQSLVRYLLLHTNLEITACYSSELTSPKSSLTRNPRYRIVYGDLTDANVWNHLLENATTLVHLAQRVNAVPPQLPSFEQFLNNEATPTSRLLSILEKIDRAIHLVYPSSGGTIYGGRGSNDVPYSETEAPLPVSFYGLQKLMCEHYIRLICGVNKNVSANILRITNPYGTLLSRSRQQGFIGIALNQLRRGRPVEIWGDPKAARDFIHQDDLNEAIFKSFAYKSGVEIFNIGSGEAIQLQTIIDSFSEILGFDIPCINTGNKNPFTPDWNAVDISKAKSVLDWSPRINLADGLRGLVRVLLRDPLKVPT